MVYELAVRGQSGVQVDAWARLRIGMDEGCGQPGQGVHEPVFGVDGDFVGLDGSGGTVDDDFAFRPELMADPAEPD
jgi:hypothetical protein